MKKIYYMLFVLIASQYLFAQTDTTKSYNVSEVVVTGARLEETPVGPYNQPEWTTRRRFPSTRVYVQTLPGEANFEQWLEVRVPPKASDNTKVRQRQELEFGLGNRLQLDLYMNTVHERNGEGSTYNFRGWSAEIRYAFADWDKIPGNPTLYFEYLFFNGDADYIEPKILLGGELAPQWHWGVNLIYEGELSGQADRDQEYAATAVCSYTIFDEKFSVGPSISYATSTERTAGTPDNTEVEWLVGPSFQFRPVKRASIDLEPLFGVTDESKKMKMFIVFSWQL